MRVVRREIVSDTRSRTFRIYPMWDWHVGASNCDEVALRRRFAEIKKDEDGYWIGGGDYADFIQRNDPRFHPNGLAAWIGMGHLGDISGAQKERVLDISDGAASKCLLALEGNHEQSISKHYERGIYHEIVTAWKERAGHPPTYRLGGGYSAYLQLVFRAVTPGMKSGKANTVTINLFCHHGYGGGMLKGAPALTMERELMRRSRASVVIMGHNHGAESMIVPGTQEIIRKNGVLERVPQWGIWSGHFKAAMVDTGTTWEEMRGFPPSTTRQPVIEISPWRKYWQDRIRVIC